uniref:Uncharacterized protein n=1 Tax=Arundo donax TaxID=35708 RepID=A0A0A9CL05_ARUDO
MASTLVLLVSKVKLKQLLLPLESILSLEKQLISLSQLLMLATFKRF